MSMLKDYEYIITEVNGETILIPMRKSRYSVFYKFDELQGIVGNNGGKKCSKSESCYVPARELLKKEQNGPVLTKKKNPPRNTGNEYGGKKYSKSESCYVPARELLKKEQNGPVLTKKKNPPRNTGNE